MSTHYISKAEQTEYLAELVRHFKRLTGMSYVDYEIKERSDGDYLIIYLANPSNRFFDLLQQSLDYLPEENVFKDRATIKRRPGSPDNRLELPETQLLRTVLSESLTATRHSFADDFFDKYVRSVSGVEEQIVGKSNHIVFGRRGAGKSSLLAYLMHNLRQQEIPYAWVDIQAYTRRADIGAVTDILIDIISQFQEYYPEQVALERLIDDLEDLLDKVDEEAEPSLRRLIPRIKRHFGKIASKHNQGFIFLDDFHTLANTLQPVALDILYAICRGNQIFLKASGIEQFVRLRNPEKRIGLEPPGDIQIVRLDYNLTMPDKSKKHIREILDSHAVYSGLPSITYISHDDVINRLVWVSAGVPRDALYLFSQAISESNVKDQKKVSVSSVNASASEMIDEKLRDIQQDASERDTELRKTLETIKKFCIVEQRTNGFLVETRSDEPAFEKIEQLIALRLLHILRQSITPDEVNRRYMALMLDFGFYVGIRAARSVDLFSKEPKALLAQEVRKFPKFDLSTIE